MSVKWTSKQQQVISLRDCNILVSAAAGSGKTAVLVERILSMLVDETHSVDVDELLIVTFTEAAAAEMKERIRQAIEKKLLENGDNEHLKRQVTLIHSAQITTIHSFCLSVIREHFHAIDIDPGFRIGEEGELKLLRHDVLREVLESCYFEASPAFLQFVEAYAGKRDDKKMEELILKLYEFARSYPDAEGWLSMCVDAYNVSDREAFENSSFWERIRQQVDQYTKDALEMAEMALAICLEEDGPAVYEETIQSDILLIKNIARSKTYEQLYDAANSIKWAKLKANRDKTVSEEKVKLVKAIREDVKTMLNDIGTMYFYESMEGLLEDFVRCKSNMEVLAFLVRSFWKAFDEKKRTQNLIDFGDMEQYALKILTVQKEGDFVPSAVAQEYQEQYKEIMIDEYQDSNLIQEAILTSVSTVSRGIYNIFMVGDVKQSIYRFRLSRPELFMDKYRMYQAEGGNCRRIDLHQNFRSRKEVLFSTNEIFEQIMTPALGGIAYDEAAALYPGAEYEEPEENGANDTEILLLSSDVPDAKEAEAKAIAMRIRELLKRQKVLDKKTGAYRSARYSDIVILVRSIRGFADAFSQVLNKEGIPTFAGTKEGYFETQEIGVLLDYLRVIHNQKQDIPLAAVLTSPFAGLTDCELAQIKSDYREAPFCSAVLAYAEEGNRRNIREKLNRCLSDLERYREKAPYTPIHELLWKIMEETGYGDLMAAMPGGEQRKANLEMLIEKARMFETSSYKGLFQFIRYIEQMQKYDVDYGEAALLDEQSDTVRIMTIHKSKGLEFPIVFVSGMGKRFNMQDARSSVVLHPRLGVGLDAVDVKRRTKSPGIIKRVIQKEEVQDSLGEELRVLYVALTRAKEKLIITGISANMEKQQAAGELAARFKGRALPFSFLSRAGTYLDWLVPAAVRFSKDVPAVVRCISAKELAEEEVGRFQAQNWTREQLEHWDTGRIYDEQMHTSIGEQFEYEYPYESIIGQKLKYTVSELKKRAFEEEAGEILYAEEEVVPFIPAFLKEEETFLGAARGTAYHRLLELLDFRRKYEEQNLSEAIENFCKQGFLGEDMAACISIEDILAFVQSDAGRRMHKAACGGKLFKEQPFVLGINAEELYEKEGDMVLVQGIIDVFFEEEDGLVVLDYKTDKVKRAKDLSEKYDAQLDYYAKALEQITGKRVKEKVIYSFTLREEIKI